MGVFSSWRARSDNRSRGFAAAVADAAVAPDNGYGQLEPVGRHGEAISLVAESEAASMHPVPHGIARSSKSWPRPSAATTLGPEAAGAQETLGTAAAASVGSAGAHGASAGPGGEAPENSHSSAEVGWLARSRIRAAATAAFKPVLLKRGQDDPSHQREQGQPATTQFTARDVLTGHEAQWLLPVPSDGQFGVSNAVILGELANPGERYQLVTLRPMDWIAPSAPDSLDQAPARPPRRGRHARPELFPAPLSKDVSSGSRPELLELTAAREGWHHRQSGHGFELTDRLREQIGPRHAASRRELRMGYGEDAARAGGAPVERYTAERDDVGVPVAWPEEDFVSRETSPAHGLVSSTPGAKPDSTDRSSPMPRPAKPRTIAVANQKGGVGKTTTTVNFAAALATHGCRVLVLDLDPQGNASTALGVDHFAGIPSVYEVIIEGKPLTEILRPAAGVEGLFCAPATIDLAGAEIELVALVARESRLARALSSFDEYFDYILVDCPPSLGLLTVNAFVAAEEVLIPIQCEYYALEGLGQLLRNVDLVRMHLNPKLRISTIVLTMFDGRTRLAAQVADEVRQHFEGLVLDTTIPRSVRISEAPSYGQTVITYDPVSTGALSYIDAARELAARGASPTDSAGQRTSWGAP